MYSISLARKRHFIFYPPSLFELRRGRQAAIDESNPPDKQAVSQLLGFLKEFKFSFR